MKILLYGLNYAPEPVGIGKYSGELAKWLCAQGHQIRVITAPPYFPAWRVSPGFLNCYGIEVDEGVKIYRCPIWVPRRPRGITRLLHLASFALSSLGPLLAQCFWTPDVVITVAPAVFCAPGTLLLGSLCGEQTNTWLHIQDFELDAAFELGLLKGQLLRSLAEAWERSTLRRFTRVSSISNSMVSRLGVKGVQLSHTYKFPNWVDLNLIYPQSNHYRDDNSYRRELNIASDQLVLMYSGSMNKKQGLDLLVRVIHQLSDIPHLTWLLAGEGPTKAELVSATQGLSQVRHLPLQPLERMNDWLNVADIHLLPQKAEAADLVLPSKLLGILASGRPVVATSTPGSELACIADEAGFCVNPGDVDTFSTRIRSLISDSQLRSRLGTQARNIAVNSLDKNTILRRFEEQLLLLSKNG
ncbi:glycosyltransferase WbuB [Synechococcus sp. RS9902]|uniref:glycosyltransferase WbuB n=1 Tax=Synechococcus sp. RS9902 TaxID=221345 RepID=UPI001647BD9F|nr:glycosyltransferase WbuB [Synechococcus sp. RS9902]QNI97105.1 conserved hypothetical protein distantly related to alpha-glycosyltransferases family 4 [Synechococcus sp. RS9902]